MRDIRPSRSEASRQEKDRDIELYEASREAKQVGRRRDEQQSAESPRTQSSKRSSRWSGSTVPVTNIDVSDNVASSHSDADHRQAKRSARGKRQLFFPRVSGPTKKSAAKRRPRVGSGERKVLLMFFGLLVVASGVAAVIFLPTANIVLNLRTAPLLVDEELTVGAGGGSADPIIAGTVFFREVAVTGSVPVANTETIGAKASGTVTLINRSTEQQQIKEQSRLVTEDGQLFFMQKFAIISADSRATVAVEAAEAGEQGNIGPQRLDFAALDESSQQLIYGEVTEALSGGSGEVVSVVGESDIEQARRQAAEQARAQVEGDIRSELPESWIILEESWTGEMTSFETTAKAGEATPELDYTARVTVRAMGFGQEQLLERLQETLDARLDDEFMLFPGSISYTKSVKDVDWDAAQAKLAVRVTHTTIPRLNLDTLREKLAGRSLDEAQDYLEGLPGVRSAEVTLWPFWVQSVPRIDKRISLELEPGRQP